LDDFETLWISFHRSSLATVKRLDSGTSPE
jgi:hypothetical protein